MHVPSNGVLGNQTNKLGTTEKMNSACISIPKTNKPGHNEGEEIRSFVSLLRLALALPLPLRGGTLNQMTNYEVLNKLATYNQFLHPLPKISDHKPALFYQIRDLLYSPLSPLPPSPLPPSLLSSPNLYKPKPREGVPPPNPPPAPPRLHAASAHTNRVSHHHKTT